jgi:hypothetical protein
MNFNQTIHQLLIEKKKIEQAIAMLEELQSTHIGGSIPLLRKRPGRKVMTPEERRQLSERMKKYWASRKHPSA